MNHSTCLQILDSGLQPIQCGGNLVAPDDFIPCKQREPVEDSQSGRHYKFLTHQVEINEKYHTFVAC